LLVALSAAEGAFAQKQGGVLRIPVFDSPASMSIHEESAIIAERAMMGIFNNLVIFDQHVKQNSMQSIVPDLATGWSWNEDGTELTLSLREGVKWHDGKPFSVEDVKCTWDLLTGKSQETLRINPRKSWYRNLGEVTTNGDYKVTFHLKRRQPAFLACSRDSRKSSPRRHGPRGPQFADQPCRPRRRSIPVHQIARSTCP
jgi:peptide/nickel transport system substrate-binding protein